MNFQASDKANILHQKGECQTSTTVREREEIMKNSSFDKRINE